MSDGEPGVEDILDVGHTVARKLLAAWGQGGILERTPANAVSLYGLTRLTDSGGDYDAFVDMHMAAWLFAGPMPQDAFACLRMGGMAGAFRLVQGRYLRRGSGREALREHVDRLVREHPRLDGVFSSPSPAGQGIRVETLWTVCPFLAMSGLVIEDDAPVREAVNQLLGGEAALKDPETGLYRHAASWFEPGRTTPDAWARGNGCAVAAFTETLRYLPETHPNRDRLIASLIELLERLLPLQAAGGLWRQELANPASEEEASGSALIGLGLAAALEHGWLPKEVLPAAWRAWAGLAGCVDVRGNGNVSRVCVETGPGESPNHYRDLPMSLNDPNGFGPLMLAASTFYELARKRRWTARPTPSRSCDAPAEAEVAACFARAHELCEAAYNGDGSWGRGTLDFPEGHLARFNSESRGPHPLLRHAGYCALGYLGALRRANDATYAERAKAGLDWLAQSQEPDGSFRLYTRKREGQVNHNGCLFVTGIAGAALAKGYERFGDERHLEASARTARWEVEWPVTRNVNFNAFAIWHLAEHYRLTGDDAALEAAIHKAKWRLMTRQQVAGGWQGHDSWIWYHGIVLRSYAALARALPKGHALHGDLRPAALAAADYFADLQQDDGSLLPNPDTPTPSSSVAFAIVSLSMLAGIVDDARALDTLHRVVEYRISPQSGPLGSAYNDEQGYRFDQNSPDALYALGAYLEFLAEREAGKAPA